LSPVEFRPRLLTSELRENRFSETGVSSSAAVHFFSSGNGERFGEFVESGSGSRPVTIFTDSVSSMKRRDLLVDRRKRVGR
jgi:hypothetical protein